MILIAYKFLTKNNLLIKKRAGTILESYKKEL